MTQGPTRNSLRAERPKIEAGT